MLDKLPFFTKGIIFAASLSVLVFFLKVLCPLNLGCFADPFLIPLFSPLFVAENLFGNLGIFEPFFILIFWSVVGGLAGHFYGKLRTVRD
ncbi:MAG TPA: hypothetical protein VJC12_00390 [Candidatus Paceibacterota bacterium]